MNSIGVDHAYGSSRSLRPSYSSYQHYFGRYYLRSTNITVSKKAQDLRLRHNATQQPALHLSPGISDLSYSFACCSVATFSGCGDLELLSHWRLQVEKASCDRALPVPDSVALISMDVNVFQMKMPNNLLIGTYDFSRPMMHTHLAPISCVTLKRRSDLNARTLNTTNNWYRNKSMVFCHFAQGVQSHFRRRRVIGSGSVDFKQRRSESGQLLALARNVPIGSCLENASSSIKANQGHVISCTGSRRIFSMLTAHDDTSAYRACVYAILLTSLAEASSSQQRSSDKLMSS